MCIAGNVRTREHANDVVESLNRLQPTVWNCCHGNNYGRTMNAFEFDTQYASLEAMRKGESIQAVDRRFNYETMLRAPSSDKNNP